MVVALCQSIITFKLALWNFNAIAPRHTSQTIEESFQSLYLHLLPSTDFKPWQEATFETAVSKVIKYLKIQNGQGEFVKWTAASNLRCIAKER